VAFSSGQARIRRDLQLVQCILKRRTACKRHMGRVDRCLSGTDMDMDKLQMCGKQSRGDKCGLKHRFVCVAAAGKYEYRFHVRIVRLENMIVAEYQSEVAFRGIDLSQVQRACLWQAP